VQRQTIYKAVETDDVDLLQQLITSNVDVTGVVLDGVSNNV